MGTFNKLVIASVTAMAVSTQVAMANPFSALEPASNSQHGYLYDEEGDAQENSDSSEQNEISEPVRTAEQNTTAEPEISTEPHKQPEPVVVSEQDQAPAPEVIITEKPASVSEPVKMPEGAVSKQKITAQTVNTAEQAQPVEQVQSTEQKSTVEAVSVAEQKKPVEHTAKPVVEPEQDDTRSEVAATRTKKDPFAAIEPSSGSQHGYLYSEEEMEAESVTSAASQQQSKASSATDKKQHDDSVLSSLQKLDLDSAVKKLTNNLDEITFSEGVDEEVFKGLEPGPGSR